MQTRLDSTNLSIAVYKFVSLECIQDFVFAFLIEGMLCKKTFGELINPERLMN